MSKYIDADKLIITLEWQNVDKKIIEPVIRTIRYLQQEQPEVVVRKNRITFYPRGLKKMDAVEIIMKAKDLMIGDWVVWATRPTKIDAIAEGGFSVHLKDEGWQSVDAVEPIKLTPEILEKNGFEFGYTAREEDFCSVVGCGYPEEKGWCYDEGAGEVKIVFPKDTDGGFVRLDDECGNRHLEFNYAEPIMVHELQHALRLCGIEKGIEL